MVAILFLVAGIGSAATAPEDVWQFTDTVAQDYVGLTPAMGGGDGQSPTDLVAAMYARALSQDIGAAGREQMLANQDRALLASTLLGGVPDSYAIDVANRMMKADPFEPLADPPRVEAASVQDALEGLGESFGVEISPAHMDVISGVPNEYLAAVTTLLVRVAEYHDATQTLQDQGLDQTLPGYFLSARQALAEAALLAPAFYLTGADCRIDVSRDFNNGILLDFCRADTHHFEARKFRWDAWGNDTYGNFTTGAECRGGVCMAVVLDGHGQDTYYGRPGGANGKKASAGRAAVAFLADLGDGDDVYSGNTYHTGHAPAGTNGGAAWQAVGFLMDEGGSDQYMVGAQTNAAGNGGARGRAFGTLIDLGHGNDTYATPTTETQGGFNGGAHAARGLLIDMGGDDEYLGADDGVNGGAYDGGVGVLVDGAGNDSYLGSWFGVNGGSRSGDALASTSGLLIDGDGNDTYVATNGVGANGGASTRDVPDSPGDAIAIVSTGALFDFGGDDEYLTPAWAANGGSQHRGLGMLLDAGAGDDWYNATEPPIERPTRSEGGTNGGAWGAGAFGLLVDERGGDHYNGGSNGVNGGGWQGGVGALVDQGGDDHYHAGSHGTNGGAYQTGSVGLLFDRAGDDYYEAADHATNGGAYLFGSGNLLDFDGSDEFRAYGHGTNGGAELHGRGVLLNLGFGTDLAKAANNGTNGGGVRGGWGLLFSGEGDTVYDAGANGTNGGATGVSFGGLIDLGGDDVYQGEAPGTNGATSPNEECNPSTPGLEGQIQEANECWTSEATGGAGVLIDAQGHDQIEPRYPYVFAGTPGGIEKPRAFLCSRALNPTWSVLGVLSVDDFVPNPCVAWPERVPESAPATGVQLDL